MRLRNSNRLIKSPFEAPQSTTGFGKFFAVMVYFSGPSADVTLFTGLASRMAAALI